MKKSADCLHCKSSFEYDTRHSKGKFCSNQCQQDKRHADYIEGWLEGTITGGSSYNLSAHVRRHLLKEANYKCSQCGWGKTNPHTNSIPLEIDHINNDPFDHSPENLQVLCPNCHSLKTIPPSKSKGGRYSKSVHPKYARLAQR